MLSSMNMFSNTLNYIMKAQVHVEKHRIITWNTSKKKEHDNVWHNEKAEHHRVKSCPNHQGCWGQKTKGMPGPRLAQIKRVMKEQDSNCPIHGAKD